MLPMWASKLDLNSSPAQTHFLGLSRDKRLVSRKALMGSEVIIRGSEYHRYIDFKQSLAELVYLFHIP